MNRELSLAYSTCPNDTFSFFAIAHDIVKCPGISFKIFLEDVETLNKEAHIRKYDITKLSFAALAHLRSSYRLLKSGAALGRGCGPLIVARPGYSLEALPDAVMAVPGMDTTAFMLASLYLGMSPMATPMKFDRIMPEISKGNFDFGVIIHEGRFTYRDHGLVCILDLGQWWEETTGHLVPLGCIAAKKSLPEDVILNVEEAISESIRFAFQNPDQTEHYVRKYAMEMSPSVIKQHIGLYVNEFSLDIGTQGASAVETLFSNAEKIGLI